MRQDVQKSAKIISGILRIGSGLSIALMAVGLILLLVRGSSVNLQGTTFIDMRSLPAGVAALHPAAIMTLGVFVLLLTPIFRVVAAIISFLFMERDLKYALISLGVLIILGMSFLVPGFK